jgi:Tfp pilus assembly protein PilP
VRKKIMKVLTIYILLVVGCGGNMHHQFASALNNADEQTKSEITSFEESREDLYYELIVQAVDNRDDREAAWLWHVATKFGQDSRTSSILHKRIGIENPTRFNEFVHMLGHHSYLINP